MPVRQKPHQGIMSLRPGCIDDRLVYHKLYISFGRLICGLEFVYQERETIWSKQ